MNRLEECEWFDGSEVKAIHYSTELGFGRKSTCSQNGADIACFIGYYDKGDNLLEKFLGEPS